MKTKEYILNTLKDNVIRKYGFEAKESIEFCELVEKEDKVFSAKIGNKYRELMED